MLATQHSSDLRAACSVLRAAGSYAVAEVELVKGPAIVRHVFQDPSASNALITLQVVVKHLHRHCLLLPPCWMLQQWHTWST